VLVFGQPPRFTQLEDKANKTLVGFGKVSDYAEHIVKPNKQVNRALIVEEWDNILRILVSLALKKTTQSKIVQKLSSHKKNPTLNALIALDEIMMSDYLLDYIDNKEIRMAVQSSLCRGESYHQLSGIIAKVNGGRMLNGKSEIELDINAQSIRLIANAVIHYNATLLSGLFEHYRDTEPEKLKIISRLSPVAWQHISFIGKYEFYNKDNLVNIQKVIKLLVDNSKIDI
jgi:TnpA family transposase